MYSRILYSAVFVCALPLSADAAVLYLDPPTGTYGRGDTFTMQVRVNNEDECINAAHIEIHYPTTLLRAVDFSRGSSIFSLWVEEPTIDTEKGTIRFAGGVPGGYCGRIPGDPVLSNILGRIVFTVLGGDNESARVAVSKGSLVYLNDGLGSEATVKTEDAVLTIGPVPLLPQNEWLNEVGEDTTPPDAFQIHIDSTQGVFDGKYYAVFSTVDKQSGLDHYEIFERGAWKRIESPYKLRDQVLRDTLEIKAIDKAGNERLGTYDPSSIPERKTSPHDYALIIGIVVLLFGAGVARWYTRQKAAQGEDIISQT